MLSKLSVFVKRSFSKHLLLTNIATYSSLLALGDCFVQHIEHHAEGGEKQPYNYHRTGRVFILGVAMAPLNHVWYKVLDRVITGTGGKVAAKKILAEQFSAAPFFLTAYITGIGALERKSGHEIYQELSDKFLFIYLVDWFVWPPAQFINFYFLPTQYRVAYVSVLTLCWNCFLSYVKHKNPEPALPAIEKSSKKRD
ncbi:mpv17-like protein 2 [Haliotis rufescens]|uniref:mpv17-like protein 2 n=1 Tax=Haliotis rufescens TaxID=6454 RepID=UPI001EB08903|nr:mpv17-like protein 2 [Haliotis rufescens]